MVSSANNVVVRGNYAYISAYTTGSGLVIVDINDPINPYIIGQNNTSGFFNGIALNGNYAYMTDEYPGDLYVFDISNPSSPTLLRSIGNAENSCNVAVDGNYAYVADWQTGVGIFDVTNPANPKGISYVDNAACDYAVSGNNGMIFIGGLGGFKIFSDIDTLGGYPLANVTLTLSGDTNLITSSDSSGYYEFTLLSDGNYIII